MSHIMASTFVKSVRVSPELWALIEAEAARRGSSANAVLVEAIATVFEGKVPAGLVVETPGEPYKEAPKVEFSKAKPKATRGLLGRLSKDQRAVAHDDVEAPSVQFGPVTPKPGARLKRPK